MDTIKQRIIPVAIDGAPTIDVRRMKWKDAREFLRRFGAHAEKFAPLLTDADSSTLIPDIDAFLEKASEVVTATNDLTAFLVERSTSLTTAQADDLDTLVALEILRASLELNLGDELKNSLLGIGNTLAALFPSKRKTNSGASSTPTS